MIKSPFPYFGGKARIAAEVWSRLGVLQNYVEPFFGSGAVLLARPDWREDGPRLCETINDADGLLCNFWRSLALSPDETAHHADWPVSECDLHARHLWLVERRESITERLCGDPDWHDPKAAGWWVWGICAWIGSGWCSGDGPWVRGEGGVLVRGDAGCGGVNRRRPHLGDRGTGVHRAAGASVLAAVAVRMRHVRVCCGDWSRVCGPTPTTKHGLTGVFLDPPYDLGMRAEVYANESGTAAAECLAWAAEHGDDPQLRICLAGYAGEHDRLEALGWEVVEWKTKGGYGSQAEAGRGRENSTLERLWFSPHCLKPTRARQVSLFGEG